MFGKTPFDKTLFDRESSPILHLYVTMKAEAGVDVRSLRVLVQIGDVKIDSSASVDVGPLAVYVPVGAVIINSQAGMSGRISVLAPFGRVTMNAESALEVSSLRTDEAEEFTLENINLRPGQQLIIDTDTLEAEIDNEPVIDAWVSGSTFFQLKNGGNIIRCYDNAESRDLIITVQWYDRYL